MIKEKEIINDWLNTKKLDLRDFQFQYLKEGKEITLSYDLVLEAIAERIQVNKMEDYYENKWWDRKNKDQRQALTQEIASFFKDMANYKIFKNYNFFSWEELSNMYKMEIDFLKFWMNENKLNEQHSILEN